MNAQKLATYIYEEFKKIYNRENKFDPPLPPFYYNVGTLQNDGIVFTLMNADPIYYGEYLNFEYSIRFYSPKSFHQNQLFLIKKFIDFILDNFNKIKIDNKYKVSLLIFNNLKQPEKEWVYSSIESYNEISQCYLLNLKIILGVENEIY